ncbi:OmpP1/FadL family transporter [Desulfovibrio ferrophilus]|uniref:Long-chain fatty acid transport protein n=1 Tax=Desulfovibrio ferrophilus TaxID=241368 RepID=A0A2Z6AY31_9BACT|nr:outer membrane protein transport protein [Desulfovibrio ferrophilus]BBD08167.1 long-chain fatty acid transport protein [Desulfovibrio ferrophilus]
MRTWHLFIVLGALLGLLVIPEPAHATNGDNLISVGPVSRAMGGVGIASPQDSASAVFANPAAMCFGPYCPSSEASASMTLFKPTVKAKVTNGTGSYSATSEEKTYPIPTAALSYPLSNSLRFGLAAYGVSGMGVDYRDTGLDSIYVGAFPQSTGTYTILQRMKVAPALAYQVNNDLSIGLAVHLHYASLDLGNGPKDGITVGFQPGIIYKPTDQISLGLTYISPQEINHENVADFNSDGIMDGLKLESPQIFGAGLAWEPNMTWLIETDVKWINWSNATGYKDFGWKDQWVFNIGAQYRGFDSVVLRAGYNYAPSPVDLNDNFDGTENVIVQDKGMPRYYYETFRLVGFPAIVEHHITLGATWDISKTFSVDLAYMHAFENKISVDGTDFTGATASIESSLYEDSLTLGLSWLF